MSDTEKEPEELPAIPDERTKRGWVLYPSHAATEFLAGNIETTK